ncbi:unnamed protein product [Chrysodeixis includens]|uniref:Uncharacterized protein n=1 Tax=Chrysodeixis includens TaxID=689277 RepID=A0A9N8KYL7_CHRIL|nr:unnamed protein product [Chrysodeixis includens]
MPDSYRLKPPECFSVPFCQEPGGNAFANYRDIVHQPVLTQVHSLLFFGRQSDTTGERSGAGPTFLRAFRNTEAVILISKTHTTFKKSQSVRAVGIELETFDLTVLRSYH